MPQQPQESRTSVNHDKHRVSIVLVTPSLAQEWLDSSTNFRKISPRMVAAIAKAMLAGTFRSLNGATICLDPDGLLRDGFHRMTALVQTGVTLPFTVMHGVTEIESETIDTGRARSLIDYLSYRGEQETASLGSLLLGVYRQRVLLGWAAEAKDYDTCYLSLDNQSQQCGNYQPPPAELLAIFDSATEKTRDEMRASVVVATAARRSSHKKGLKLCGPLTRTSQAAFLVWRARQVFGSKWLDDQIQLFYGSSWSVKTGSPIKVYKHWLGHVLNAHENHKPTFSRHSVTHKLCAALCAAHAGDRWDDGQWKPSAEVEPCGLGVADLRTKGRLIW